MRKYFNINLDDRSTETEELNGAACIRVGRHFIAKTLLEKGAAKVDALSPGNPLIFSAGPLAGTNFSNANRISVGCKSPLTGGIKEANFETLINSKPQLVIEKAVKGMMPRNPLGRDMLRKLKVYAGTEHPHTAQQPQQLEI